MKLNIVALGLLTGLSRAVGSLGRFDEVEEFSDSIVPGSYIVEFEDGEDPTTFYDGLRSGGMRVNRRMDMNYSLFKGASFTVENHASPQLAVRNIAANSRIKSIWPVGAVQIPKPEPQSVGNGAQGSFSDQGLNATSSETSWSTHVMTQVDKLRADGYTGKGVRIGLVDSGVDYLHSALGGCFGEGCLVSFGLDLTGDDFGPTSAPVEDEDPRDACFGHGTHVSGIIAAQENEFGFTGVAPGVTLGMFKGSGCNGYTTTDILMAALSKAYEAGSDIISCSAGSASGWAEEPWAMLASRIVGQGVPVIFSAGNSGAMGLFYAATPGTGDGVASVGSTDNINVPIILTSSSFRLGNGSAERFGWLPGNVPITANASLPLWSPSTNFENGSNACQPLPDDTPDLSEYISIVRMEATADCLPTNQAENIAEKGGQYVLYYTLSNTTTQSVYLQYGAVKGIGSVTPRQAASWLESLAAGETVLVDIHQGEVFVEQTANDASAGLVSTYSSWGPSWEVTSKPQFTAPGGYILSTYPLDLGGYAVLSGTSMAAPFVAGVYALLAEARGTTDPAELLGSLAATAQPSKYYDGVNVMKSWAPVPQQGSGQIQASDAAQVTTQFSNSSISLKDSDSFEGNQTFTINNRGSGDVTYFISHLETQTGYYYTPGTMDPALFPNPAVDDHAEVTFDSTEVLVPAGGSAEVHFSVVPPHLNETLLPTYGGFIKVIGSTTESLFLPYVGVVGSLFDTPTMSPSDTYLASTADYATPSLVNATFTLPHPSLNQTGFHGPTPVIRLKVGSPHVRVDVVPLSDVDLPTTDVFGFASIGEAPGFPVLWASRGAYQGPLLGKLADGTEVPEGTYKLVVSALRVYGDESQKEDWDILELVPFNIKYRMS